MVMLKEESATEIKPNTNARRTGKSAAKIVATGVAAVLLSICGSFCGSLSVPELDSVCATPSPFISGSSALAAPGDFEQGMALFKGGRNYAAAAAAFRRAVVDGANDPNLPNIYYYYALSLHYAKDKLAQVEYLEIIRRWPGSEAATRAQQGLNLLAPGMLASLAPSAKVQSYSGSRGSGTVSSSSSGGTSGDIIPTACIVNFDLINNHMVVDVAFNGRRTKAIFDTGAEMILMGKNHLAELGLPEPRGETIARSRGVGGKIEEVWGQRMDVTCGAVTRKNIMVHIQEHMDTLPLLGLPFTNGMNYGIDGGSIRFAARPTAAPSSSYSSASSASRSNNYNDVPYTMEGHTMVVRAKVNGKDVAMCLDTGAASTLFTRAQATALGINVDNEADANLGSGVGGNVTGRYTVLNSISLGPVNQRDFRVGVSDLSHQPFPLLGKDFWEGHPWTLDSERHVIHFN